MKSKKTDPKAKAKVKIEKLKLHKQTIEDFDVSEGQAAKVKGGLSQVCPKTGTLGQMQCWVARAVYGEDNPRWLLFRAWLVDDAPAWFRNLYLRYGERFALWLAPHTAIKSFIRLWMDSRIERKSYAVARLA